MIDKQRVTELMMGYCRIDSAPLQERLLFEQVRADLVALGFTAWEDDAAGHIGGQVGNLTATMPGKGAGAHRRPVMFSAHLDRVAGGIGVRPVVKNGAVYSDGSTILGADDAAGIAAIIEGCTVLQESDADYRPVEIVLTVAEEIGLLGAKQYDVSQLKAEFGYVLDASGDVGAVVVEAPTQYALKARFFGRAAHAGVAPEKGVSAIKIAARAVSKMKLGRLDDKSTANVGYIAGGGPTNIVPEHAEIRAETRSLDPVKAEKQLQSMVDACRRAADELGGGLLCDTTLNYDGFKLDPDSPVIRHFTERAASVGLTPRLVSTGGGSDGNVFNAKGLPTAVLGVGYRAIHTHDEHMPIDQLVHLARLVVSLTRLETAG